MQNITEWLSAEAPTDIDLQIGKEIIAEEYLKYDEFQKSDFNTIYEYMLSLLKAGHLEYVAAQLALHMELAEQSNPMTLN